MQLHNQNEYWKEIQHIWLKKIHSIPINSTNKSKEFRSNEKHIFNMQNCQEFIEDLNKKVVMTKIRIQKLNESQNIGQFNEIFQKQALKLTQKQDQSSFLIENYSQKQNNKSEIKLPEYERRILQLQEIIQQKNNEIVKLKSRISIIQNQNQSQNYYFGQNKEDLPNQSSINQNTKSKKEQSLKKFNKQLTLDLDLINDIQTNENVKLYQIESQQASQTASVAKNNSSSQINILYQLPSDDPVFKMPCLSPTMIQMKNIQKMEIQRRKKFRQMRKDTFGAKTTALQIQNIAAGVNSPKSFEMLQNAQNPLKQKFIRKPMSPIFNVLYQSPKHLEEKIDEQQNVKNEEKDQILQEPQINQNLASPENGLKVKLNLPYFLSKKKKQ